MAWLLILIGGGFEVAFTTCLRYTAEPDRRKVTGGWGAAIGPAGLGGSTRCQWPSWARLKASLTN